MINVYSYVANINNNCYFPFNNNTTRMIGTTDIATGKVFTFNMGDIHNQIQYTYEQSINILGKYRC